MRRRPPTTPPCPPPPCPPSAYFRVGGAAARLVRRRLAAITAFSLTAEVPRRCQRTRVNEMARAAAPSPAAPLQGAVSDAVALNVGRTRRPRRPRRRAGERPRRMVPATLPPFSHVRAHAPGSDISAASPICEASRWAPSELGATPVRGAAVDGRIADPGGRSRLAQRAAVCPQSRECELHVLRRAARRPWGPAYLGADVWRHARQRASGTGFALGSHLGVEVGAVVVPATDHFGRRCHRVPHAGLGRGMAEVWLEVSLNAQQFSGQRACRSDKRRLRRRSRLQPRGSVGGRHDRGDRGLWLCRRLGLQVHPVRQLRRLCVSLELRPLTWSIRRTSAISAPPSCALRRRWRSCPRLRGRRSRSARPSRSTRRSTPRRPRRWRRCILGRDTCTTQHRH